MGRRSSYTKVDRKNRVLASHVKGMGDVVFKGFQCLNSECQCFMFIPSHKIEEDFVIECPSCGHTLKSGGVSKFFEYQLLYKEDGSVLEEGEFTIEHSEYVAEAQEYKYCILCNTLKPLSLFDRHSARESGRQGECHLCKSLYNSIKNQTRTSDQHREAAQRRRLRSILAGEQGRIDSLRVFEKFGSKCFKCGKDLQHVVKGHKDFDLDHTLPNKYLWPLSTESATLLCKQCNNEKHDQWPSAVYDKEQLMLLAVKTNHPFELLAGPPRLNPDAITWLQVNADEFLRMNIRKPRYIKEVRKLVLAMCQFDIFEIAKDVPAYLRE